MRKFIIILVLFFVSCTGKDLYPYKVTEVISEEYNFICWVVTRYENKKWRFQSVSCQDLVFKYGPTQEEQPNE